MSHVEFIRRELRKKADKKKAKKLQKFFKTEKGQYGEGDVFLGVTVPESRKIARKYNNLDLKETFFLLNSKIHEERLVALLILIDKFQKEDNNKKEKIVNFYLENLKNVNNWDLIDVSAYKILGNYFFNKEKAPLYNLAVSDNLWEKRIAIVSTFYFIKNNRFADTLEISEILLKDKHDLIHKAVGWMLREVGKRNLRAEEDFIKKNYGKIHRTTLRYAIEKFPEEKRKKYLKNAEGLL